MRFRPCIDIHNGKVKQIVGGSLCDRGDAAEENFVSEQDAAWYAGFYEKDGLKGGHIIVLNAMHSPYYEESRRQALLALRAAPGSFQIGGGVTDANAGEYLDAGASHVIVTSFVFRGGEICRDNLRKLVQAVGEKRLVLDVSCRRKDGHYYIVTDRWQTFTDVALTPASLQMLSQYCAEFLVHGVDVEGKASGIEEDLVRLLASWGKIPITYAGGIGTMEHLQCMKTLGRDRLDVTIGSALDLFGGTLPYRDVLHVCSHGQSGSGSVGMQSGNHTKK